MVPPSPVKIKTAGALLHFHLRRSYNSPPSRGCSPAPPGEGPMKKTKKKLALAKETVRELEGGNELKQVVGGTWGKPSFECPPD
jgi:hypothetical protein